MSSVCTRKRESSSARLPDCSTSSTSLRASSGVRKFSWKLRDSVATAPMRITSRSRRRPSRSSAMSSVPEVKMDSA